MDPDGLRRLRAQHFFRKGARLLRSRTALARRQAGQVLSRAGPWSVVAFLRRAMGLSYLENNFACRQLPFVRSYRRHLPHWHPDGVELPGGSTAPFLEAQHQLSPALTSWTWIAKWLRRLKIGAGPARGCQRCRTGPWPVNIFCDRSWTCPTSLSLSTIPSGRQRAAMRSLTNPLAMLM